VQYKFSPTANVYGAISRGFTPGDLVEENFLIHPFRPEIATQYEVGYKSLLAHGVAGECRRFSTPTTRTGCISTSGSPNGPIQDLTAQHWPLDERRGGVSTLPRPLPAGIQGERRRGACWRARWGRKPMAS